MGSITFYVDGMPVTTSDRTYSLTATGDPVSPAAFKTWGDSASIDELWRTQPSLRMVTTFLAENIAQVPLHAFQRLANGDRDRLKSGHPLARAMRWPDPPRLTAYDLLRTLVLDVCLRDRYAAPVFLDPDTGHARIVRLPPGTWKFERDATNQPTGIKVRRKDGTDFTVALDRALWIDGFPSKDNTSPVESLRGILAEAELAATYRRDLWLNGGRMPGWIGRPREATWTTEARQRFREGWQTYAAGGVRAGSTPILEDGMQYHELNTGITPENGQQLESRKLSIAEVANAYHVPPQMVGQDAGSSYNSVAGYREMLYSDTLGTWFERLDQAFNMRLVPQLADPDEVFVEFNVASKLRLAFEDQARIFQTAAGGPVMTRAEVRRRMNLPYIDGTDELIVPLNVTQGGQASPTDSGSQNIGGTE